MDWGQRLRSCCCGKQTEEEEPEKEEEEEEVLDDFTENASTEVSPGLDTV